MDIRGWFKSRWERLTAKKTGAEIPAPIPSLLSGAAELLTLQTRRTVAPDHCWKPGMRCLYLVAGKWRSARLKYRDGFGRWVVRRNAKAGTPHEQRQFRPSVLKLAWPEGGYHSYVG